MPIFRQVLTLTLAALLLACAEAFVVKPAWGDPEVSLFQALDLKGLWVDARPRQEYEKEHIPGALLLNEDEWNRQLPELLAQWSAEQVVIVYCSSLQCKASQAVARRLHEETGMEVKILKGGWEAWKKQ